MIEMKSSFRALLASSLFSLTALSGCSLLGISPGGAADPRAFGARPTGYVYSTLYAKNKVLEINSVQSRVDNEPIDVPNGPRSLAMDPRDRNLFLYVVCELGNTVAVVDRRNRLVNRTINVGNAPYAMAITPNGTRGFVTNQNDNTVSVIDIGTNTVLQTIALANAVVNTGAPTTGVPVSNIPAQLKPRGIATNAAGTMVYVACAGGALAILQGTPPASTAGASQAGIGVPSTAGNYVVKTVLPIVGSVAPLNVAVATIGTADLVYITDPLANRVFFMNGADPAALPVGREVAGAPYDLAVGRNVTTGTPDSVYVSLEQRNALQTFSATDLSPRNEAVRVEGSQPQYVEVSSLGTEVYVSLAGSNNISVFGRTGSTLSVPQVFNLQQLNPAYIAPTGDIALGGFLSQ